MTEVTSEVLEAVSRAVPVQVDGWVPTVQGAVGQVLGLRGLDGTRYVLKTYPPHAAAAAATESLALDRLRKVPGVPVPAVVLSGRLGGPDPVSYLLTSRLPGVRWADRRSGLSRAQSWGLIAEVGRLLRRLHQLPGRRFGPLELDGPSWSDAWQRVDVRCDELVRQDLRADGSRELTGRIRRLVDRHRVAFDSSGPPVLCHNDFNGGNILVTESGDPAVRGVVDLEGASWDDPLWDLAKTRLHVRHHDAAAAEVLTRAYGVEEQAELQRLDVYEVLHALAERTWITLDRPPGWRRSVAVLESWLVECT